VRRFRYKATARASRNCSLVPGVTVNVPAVCPYRDCRPVVVGTPGSTRSVFTATLRPFTETDVSSTLSGVFLRGLARDAVIFPNAFVPAFNRTFPFITTFWSSCAAKVLPTGSCEVMELAVLTLSVVPAGMLAAFNDEAPKQANVTPITAINLFRFIYLKNGWLRCVQNNSVLWPGQLDLGHTSRLGLITSVVRHSRDFKNEGSPLDVTCSAKLDKCTSGWATEPRSHV
jgi:hypothetical protein